VLYVPSMSTESSIVLIAAPYDSGLRRRMGLGPDWLLEHGLVERLRREGLRVESKVIDLDDLYPAELAVGFFLHHAIADAAASARAEGSMPIALTGNCNSGVIGCLAATGRTSGRRPGLVWFDAHSDCRVPETIRDGFLDSMGLSMALGRCWQGPLAALHGFSPLAAGRAVHVGSRGLDEAELAELAAAGVEVVVADEVETTAEGRLARSLEALRHSCDEVHLHLDMDAHDASFGRANEWAVSGGLDGEEYLTAVELVLDRCDVTSVSLASYDPTTDADGRIGASAIELVLACARKSIGGSAVATPTR
jgi:arginase